LHLLHQILLLLEKKKKKRFMMGKTKGCSFDRIPRSSLLSQSKGKNQGNQSHLTREERLEKLDNQ